MILQFETLHQAAKVALERKTSERIMGRNETPVGRRTPFEAWRDELTGAIGELVVAETLRLPWDPKFGIDFSFDVTDLPNIEVRTGRLPNHRLRLRPKDVQKAKRNGGVWWVLVMVYRDKWPWTADVAGAWHSSFALDDTWIEDPHGWGSVWFVPRSSLLPIDVLGGLSD